jgi:hypothetical protein
MYERCKNFYCRVQRAKNFDFLMLKFINRFQTYRQCSENCFQFYISSLKSQWLLVRDSSVLSLNRIIPLMLLFDVRFWFTLEDSFFDWFHDFVVKTFLLRIFYTFSFWPRTKLIETKNEIKSKEKLFGREMRSFLS